MPSTIDRRPEFTPPPEPGLLRSVSLAVAAHVLLVLALSWGITWKRDDDNAVVEAELWSQRPVEAAPKPVEAPPPPPPPPAPVVQKPPAPPQPSEADIALERQREKEAQDKARREEAERQRKLEEEKREQEKREQARKLEQEKREQARKAAEEKKREELAKARERKEKEEAAALEKMRKENLERIAGLAGASGSPSSTGTALRSSGPSASYGGRLAALFRRNVVFPGGVETISGNPAAVVQVTVSPTGEILTARLKRSSGTAAWDEAAVRAIERTQRIPPDENGRYVQTFDVDMRPKAQ